MVKRSFEQEIRNKNFGARIENFEKNAVVQNQGTKQRVQRILGDCSGKPTGNVWKETIAVSATIWISVEKFHHQIHRGPEVPEAGVPVVECHDVFARITSGGTCNNSFCERWHPPENLFHKTKSGCRFGEKCPLAHRQVDAQPAKRSKTNNDKSVVVMFKMGNWQERESVTDGCHDRTRQLAKRSEKKNWDKFI